MASAAISVAVLLCSAATAATAAPSARRLAPATARTTLTAAVSAPASGTQWKSRVPSAGGSGQAASGSGEEAAADPTTEGQWGEPFPLKVVGIHATLLRDGRVLLFSRPLRHAGSEAKLWDPANGRIEDVSLRVHRDIFCGGHSMLPGGNVLVTGGTVHGSAHEEGVRHTFVFDPRTRTWEEGPRMARARWYPTNVTLPGGRTLIFSGQRDGETRIRSVERYNPDTNRLTTLPRSAWRRMDLYPRMHLLPSGKIFWAGQVRRTRTFDPRVGDWSFVDRMNFGSRYTGASVLLPGLRKVLALGGTHGAVGTATAEVIDLAEPRPRWRYVEPMHHPRKHPNAVLLPDGTVLVVGGGLRGNYEEPVRIPELYRPSSSTWTEMAPQTAPRMYHSTALLLPDGRVLSAGQDDGLYATTGEVFSPPYLFRGARPRIASAPQDINYGEPFAVRSLQAGLIERVVLMRPGSVTHSVDFEQRHIELGFQRDTTTLQVRAPRLRAVAPPGWYMLFILDGAGVPSVASWVHLH